MSLDLKEYLTKYFCVEPTEAQLEQITAMIIAPETVRVQLPMKPLARLDGPTPGNLHVCVIDTETTGLFHQSDRIVEVAYVIAEVTPQGEFVGLLCSRSGRQDPGMPISPEASATSGITNEMVKGLRINWERVGEELTSCDFVVAHNAGFDRKFLEVESEVFRTKPWACTFADIDWRARGHESSKLTNLAADFGFHFQAHAALADVYATVEVLRQSGGFALLIEALKKNSYMLKALGAAFGAKDELKKRSYKPHYVGGKFHFWYTLLPEERVEDEKQWLHQVAGCHTVPVKAITAIDKYSVRESL